jgi:hypothetical protein
MVDRDNLVLEQFRLMRAEMAGNQKTIEERIQTLSQRINAMETEVRGMNYIMTMVIGSTVHDIRDLQSRAT